MEESKADYPSAEHIEDQAVDQTAPEAWREQERLRWLRLREALQGFSVRVESRKLVDPMAHLEEVTLSAEFQPGAGSATAEWLEQLLAEPIRTQSDPRSPASAIEPALDDGFGGECANPITGNQVFAPMWPVGLETGRFYRVGCDDKGRNGGSWAQVMIAKDGDVHLSMQDWEHVPSGEPSPFPSVRIRTGAGGGHHYRTRQALLWLAEAIRLDTADNNPNG